MSSVEVVEADLSDSAHGEALVRLLDAYARDPMGGGEPLPAESLERLVEAARRSSQFGAFLALAEGRAVGVATTVLGFSTFAARPLLNVHDIYVEPQFRGAGAGRALLAAVEKRARELGCCKLTLEVVTGNLRAQRAYRAFGFEPYTLDPNLGAATFWHKVF